MRKDSATVVGATALLTAAILGGAWYMAQRQAVVPVTPEEATWTTLEPGAASAVGDANTVPDVPAETSTGRSERIIECDLPDGSKAFTNAPSCAEADFDNRLSVAAPFQQTRSPTPAIGQPPPPQRAAAADTASNRPDLRKVARPVPDGLSVACSFAVGKALELERALSAADDPAGSIWREEYCRWVKEARGSECAVGPDFFYYGHLCAYGLQPSN